MEFTIKYFLEFNKHMAKVFYSTEDKDTTSIKTFFNTEDGLQYFSENCSNITGYQEVLNLWEGNTLPSISSDNTNEYEDYFNAMQEVLENE